MLDILRYLGVILEALGVYVGTTIRLIIIRGRRVPTFWEHYRKEESNRLFT